LLPNIVVLLRDAAHIPRISVRDPLHLDDLYGEVWTELFDKRLRDDRVFTICISNLPNLVWVTSTAAVDLFESVSKGAGVRVMSAACVVGVVELQIMSTSIFAMEQG